MAIGLSHPQRVVNVNWGFPPVIVVFVSSLIYDSDPQRAATYKTILSEKENNVQFLDRWDTPYQTAGVQPGFDSVAYKVMKAGKFITSTVPTLGGDPNGMFIDVCVFAIDNSQGVSWSLDQAKQGTLEIVPARYLVNVSEAHLPGGKSDLPADIAPPGLLWFIEVGAMDSGQKMDWKARFGIHRIKDSDSALPNAMSQVYPLGPSYTSPPPVSGIWEGYTLFGYRLDRQGTGIVYSKQFSADQDSKQSVDPAWSQEIRRDTPGVKGIPFKDPPPLVSSDPTTE